LPWQQDKKMPDDTASGTVAAPASSPMVLADSAGKVDEAIRPVWLKRRTKTHKDTDNFLVTV
jgi:cell division protein ZapA (FtsZ GTPase activity inhibitor)